jgi:glycosyltransferase involved in cell wall biosynthesis
MQIDLSIILPTLNRLSYLQRAVLNLEREFQTTSHELLVVLGANDQSMPWLRARAKRYRNIKIIIDEQLDGNVQAISQCLPAVQGKYLMVSSDHFFHIGNEFKKLLARMVDQDLSAIFLKYYRAGSRTPYRIFVSRRSKSYVGNPIPRILVTPEAAVYRSNEFLKYFSAASLRFRNYGWGIYITIRLLADGLKIGHAKGYTAFEIPISDPNDLSHRRRKKNEARIIMNEVYDEFRDLGKDLFRQVPTFTRWRVRVAQGLLDWMNRGMNKSMFQRKSGAFQAKKKCHKFDDLVAFSESNYEPDSIAKSRGSTGSLDYRLFPWVAEKLFDILYPMCSAYTVTENGRSDAVLFIQQIPENLVDD